MPDPTPTTPETWRTIELLWKSQRFATFGALHRHCITLFPSDCPSLQTIRRKSDRDNWDNDTALSESIEEEQRKTASNILNELGMGLVRRLEILTEAINAPQEIHDQLREIVRKLSTGKGGEIDEKAMQRLLRDLKTTYFKGMEISLKALTIAGTMAGDMKTGKEADAGAEKPLDDMTPEEISAAIDRIVDSVPKLKERFKQ